VLDCHTATWALREKPSAINCEISRIAYTIASNDPFRKVPSMPLNRHRDATGQEEPKRNDTLVGTLRAEYGETFAPKFSEKMQLGTLKQRLGLPLDASLNDVLRHFRIKE
jgi:hypothetical protein